jgi:hypothetical protein
MGAQRKRKGARKARPQVAQTQRKARQRKMGTSQKRKTKIRNENVHTREH